MANYENFQPSTEWTSDGTTDTLVVRLPGFNKAHIKVQIDNNGRLRTGGERPLGPDQDDQWSRFKTEHSIPDDCDLRRIRARFEDGVLYVTLPKSISAEQTKMPEPEAPDNFQPSTEWTYGGTTDTLVVRLPGFNKEQVKVDIDNNGRLRTSGERPPSPGQGDRWIRFKTEHSIPEDCDLRRIRALFDDGVLYVTLPKSINAEQTKIPEPKVRNDFQPSTKWTSDSTTETLVVRLPGFNKEELKVQIDNYGRLRTSGERPSGHGQGDRWIRFKTEHSIPDDCDWKGIRARFEDGVLYVTLPKSIKAETTKMDDFQPSTKWTSDGTTDTLVVRLPGMSSSSS